MKKTNYALTEYRASEADPMTRTGNQNKPKSRRWLLPDVSGI